jgi:hypothetical protein
LILLVEPDSGGYEGREPATVVPSMSKQLK